MATKAKKVQIKDLIQGKTVYLVHSLGKSSFMTRLRVCSVDLKERKLIAKKFNPFMVESYTATYYLRDMGIIKNDYNEHITFTSRRAAIRYLNESLGKSENDIMFPRKW